MPPPRTNTEPGPARLHPTPLPRPGPALRPRAVAAPDIARGGGDDGGRGAPTMCLRRAFTPLPPRRPGHPPSPPAAAGGNPASTLQISCNPFPAPPSPFPTSLPPPPPPQLLSRVRPSRLPAASQREKSKVALGVPPTAFWPARAEMEREGVLLLAGSPGLCGLSACPSVHGPLRGPRIRAACAAGNGQGPARAARAEGKLGRTPG
jgi:hypothetical protein